MLRRPLPPPSLVKMARLGVVSEDWIDKNDVVATAIQCWTSLQRNFGVNVRSGMIESGAKQFKARFVGSRMRWSRNGAENLLLCCWMCAPHALALTLKRISPCKPIALYTNFVYTAVV
jgi:hypothetical protein